MLSRLVQQIRKFVRNEQGPTAVEYAVMIALIVVICIGTITTLGSNSNKTFTTTAKAAGKGG